MLLRNELNTIDLLTRAMDMAVRERYRSDWEQGAFTDLYLDHLYVRKVLCPVDRHLLQGMVKLPEDRELVDKARVWVAHVTDSKLDKSGVQALLSGAYQRRMKYSTPTGQKSRNSSFRDSSVSRGSAKRVPSGQKSAKHGASSSRKTGRAPPAEKAPRATGTQLLIAMNGTHVATATASRTLSIQAVERDARIPCAATSRPTSAKFPR
jgi:hypothetical protein